MYHANFPHGGRIDDPLRFDWDSDTGAISGPDADRVKRMAATAFSAGETCSHPWPTVYPIKANPLHSLPEMAAILSSDWQIPQDWVDALQTIAPQQSDYSDCDIQPIF